jgi:hypothetical protein
LPASPKGPGITQHFRFDLDGLRPAMSAWKTRCAPHDPRHSVGPDDGPRVDLSSGRDEPHAARRRRDLVKGRAVPHFDPSVGDLPGEGVVELDSADDDANPVLLDDPSFACHSKGNPVDRNPRDLHIYPDALEHLQPSGADGPGAILVAGIARLLQDERPPRELGCVMGEVKGRRGAGWSAANDNEIVIG